MLEQGQAPPVYSAGTNGTGSDGAYLRICFTHTKEDLPNLMGSKQYKTDGVALIKSPLQLWI